MVLMIAIIVGIFWIVAGAVYDLALHHNWPARRIYTWIFIAGIFMVMGFVVEIWS